MKKSIRLFLVVGECSVYRSNHLCAEAVMCALGGQLEGKTLFPFHGLHRLGIERALCGVVQAWSRPKKVGLFLNC